ncbi:MAG: tetratricopeptide repeat protein [Candidatus Brocadiaceae bacterium]|nr:tetratricopeptide repeat protein [Candidatus Brocadiaceae bacterium]
MIYKNSKIIAYRNPYIFVVVIVCLSFTVYGNSLLNQFAYDDEFTIVNNHFIKTWNNVALLFTNDYFKFSGELSYRPFVTLSYFIDYTLWGLNPFGFHLTNVFLHTTNTVLFFFLLMRLFHDRIVSFVAALIFSCHPILTETVNAVSYREDLLASTFFLVAFLFHAKTRKRFSFLTYGVSVICYLFGIFSKEIAITLPLAIFLYDLLLTKKRNDMYQYLRYYTGYLIIMIFYLSVRFILLHNPAETHVSYPGDSIVINFLTMSKVLALYITILFLPFYLCADYVVPNTSAFMDVSFILSFLFLSCVWIILYRMFFLSKFLFFSMAWFLICLLPVFNIIPIENIMAERYTYLPAMGFCMFCGIFIVRYSRMSGFLPGLQRKKIIVLPTLILIVFSIITFKRNQVWMDQATLWTKTAEASPNSFKAHNNLGNMHRDAGRFDIAIQEFQLALSLYDNYIDAHNNLGVAYRKKGMLKESLSEYKKALQLDPRYPIAHNNLGVLYAKLNYLDQAIREFQYAILQKPDYSDAHNNLGATYIKIGEYENAIEEFQEAVKYNNRYVDSYYNMGAAYFNSKQRDKALELVTIVLSMNPDHHDARELLNMIHEQKGLENEGQKR